MPSYPPLGKYPDLPKIVLLLGLGFCAFALRMAAAPPTLPQAVAEAHSIFIENETVYPELQYEAVLELNKWGHFQLTDRPRADLVMLLSSGTHVQAVPDGQGPRTVGLNAFVEESVPPGHTRIALIDPKTGTTLWSDLRRTVGGKVKGGHLLDGLREAYDQYQKSRSKK
jgi:hypothetical protein